MIVNQAEELYNSSISFTEFDELTVDESEKLFADLQNEGIIKKNCSFGDAVWYTTNQYSNIGLHFEFSEFEYKKYEEMLGFGLEDFVLYLKAYIISLFGKIALDTIRSFLLDVRHIISASPEAVVYSPGSEISLTQPRHCEEFFVALPSDTESLGNLVDDLAAYGDLMYGSPAARQRTLADFETYFLFNDLLEDYWTGQLTDEQRLFYFPLLLWWKLTAVIPLRPREFLLTQRDCLSKNDKGEYYLRLRRNQLKGGRENLKYKISEDYTIDTYQIPPALGKQIEQYIALTDKYNSTELDTLFVTDMHYRKWARSKPVTSRFLTYTNMVTILHYFYREVIHGKYGLRLVRNQDDRHLEKGEIGEIHLGDTRHIALINLMQEGGTPAIAMFMAGHMNTEMASAYYTNVTKYLECKITSRYRRVIGGQVEYAISHYVPDKPAVAGVELKSGGKCFSEAFKAGQVTDCRNVSGPNGEIGYCPSCRYFSNTTGTKLDMAEFYKRNIKDDCNALRDAIEVVRAGKGEDSTIGEAMLRLQSSTISYENYLKEKNTYEFGE